jgi:hypothetical protein
VQIQVRVTPRLGKYGQCPTLARRGSTHRFADLARKTYGQCRAPIRTSGRPRRTSSPPGEIRQIIIIIIYAGAPRRVPSCQSNPREGASGRGAALRSYLHPAVFPDIRSYLPMQSGFQRRLPLRYQHCERPEQARILVQL